MWGDSANKVQTSVSNIWMVLPRWHNAYQAGSEGRIRAPQPSHLERVRVDRRHAVNRQVKSPCLNSKRRYGLEFQLAAMLKFSFHRLKMLRWGDMKGMARKVPAAENEAGGSLTARVYF